MPLQFILSTCAKPVLLVDFIHCGIFPGQKVSDGVAQLPKASSTRQDADE
jgi:hypothetical protein